MAIAALSELQVDEVVAGGSLDLPWPRPALRVVPMPAPGAGDGTAPWQVSEEPAAGPWSAGAGIVRAPASASRLRLGTDVVARRDRRSAVRRRRRTLVMGGAAVAVMVGLALPVSALAGRPTPAAAPAGAVSGTVYVVEPGDTVWSIAQRIDGTGDPRALAEAIVHEIGSDVVVPGERIRIP